MSSVTVVIPSWNVRDLLREALRSLAAQTLAPREVVVVDNASGDGSAAMVRAEFPRVHLLCNAENLGFTRAIDQGLQGARGDHVLLLNADAELAPDCLALLAAELDAAPDVAAAAPRLAHPDGSLQRSILRFPGWRTPLFFATPLERWFPQSGELRRYFARDFDYDRDADVEQPAAAVLLVRRGVLEELDGLDERMWLFFSDVDLCRRIARTGRRIRYVAAARARHHLGGSTRQYGDFLSRWHADRLAYYRTHHGPLAGAWVKACVALAFVDFAVRQGWSRMVGREPEPVRPVTRAFGAFLKR